MLSPVLVALLGAAASSAVTVPSAPPAGAAAVDPSLLSISFEFFAFPGYTQLAATPKCLANLADLRGAQPAIRIGGTTQDRATYDANLPVAVNYTVASQADAPDTLSYGPQFITLAGQQKGQVTLGLARRLNNQQASLAAAVLAKQKMSNLFAFELGNEPEYYASNSPIITAGGKGWNQDVDAASQKSWFQTFSKSVGSMFQGAVTLSWTAGGTLTRIGSDGAALLRSLSRHSYPQSACGGASTNLPNLMSHSGIVSYLAGYKAEATQTHAAGIKYFLGETNSATCGGGGISPTFGAALWVMDWVLQGALNGVDRLYFHQGTISNCAYCFWGQSSVFTPYYGAAFVSEFLGRDGARVAMLDDGKGAVGTYVVFDAAGKPLRVLVSNTQYFDGSGTRASTGVALAGLSAGAKQVKRMTAPNANSRVDQGASVTIGGVASFANDCTRTGTQRTESLAVSGGAATVQVAASEAVIVFL